MRASGKVWKEETTGEIGGKRKHIAKREELGKLRTGDRVWKRRGTYR